MKIFKIIYFLPHLLLTIISCLVVALFQRKKILNAYKKYGYSGITDYVVELSHYLAGGKILSNFVSVSVWFLILAPYIKKIIGNE